jgi:hypothetical protein
MGKNYTFKIEREGTLQRLSNELFQNNMENVEITEDSVPYNTERHYMFYGYI